MKLIAGEANRGESQRLLCVFAIAVSFAVAFCGVAHAQEGTEIDASLDLYGYGVAVARRSTPINPDNSVVHIPVTTFGVQARPLVRASAWERRIKLMLRPRLWETLETVLAAGERDTRDTRGVTIDAFYAQLALRDDLVVSYGRQPFEWGPALFVNASNRLFHLNALQKTAIFVLVGREIAKLSYSYRSSFTAIVMVETRNNGFPTFGNERFDRKGMLKLEYASDSGRWLLGLVAGGGRITKPWLGGYGSVEVHDGWSLYIDGALSRGSRSLHPITVELAGVPTPVYQRTLASSRRLEVLNVLGSKYTTSFGLQFGLEWIANTAGYSRRELRAAYRAALMPSTLSPEQLAQNRAALSNPGLETLARHQLYFTALMPQLPTRREVHLSVGYSLSLTDLSGQMIAYGDVALGQGAVLFANLTATHGARDAERSSLVYGNILVGARCSF